MKELKRISLKPNECINITFIDKFGTEQYIELGNTGKLGSGFIINLLGTACKILTQFEAHE